MQKGLSPIALTLPRRAALSHQPASIKSHSHTQVVRSFVKRCEVWEEGMSRDEENDRELEVRTENEIEIAKMIVDALWHSKVERTSSPHRGIQLGAPLGLHSWLRPR
jgi:hypothetical protein